MYSRSRITKLISGAFIVASGSALVVTGVAYHLINKSTGRPVYSPERQKQHAANRHILLNQFHAQHITFETDDCLKLAGYLILRPHAKRNLLVCHGYRMCKERMCSFAFMFPDDNILLFDLRAHGQSEGTRTTFGYDECKDVQAASKVLQTNPITASLPLYGIGTSMGAVSLLEAACVNGNFKAIVLDSPFAQLDIQARQVFKHKFKLSIIPFERLVKRIFKYVMHFSLADVTSLSCAQQVKVPVMIIHAQYDHIASIADAQQIYHVIPTKKEFWLVDTHSHAQIFDDFPEEYSTRVNQFFAACA